MRLYKINEIKLVRHTSRLYLFIFMEDPITTASENTQIRKQEYRYWCDI